MSAEEIRGFAALLTAPAATACGGVRVGDDAAEALLRQGGAVCIGRVMDVLHDEGRFYDTSEYVRARGMIDLPGACPVFRVAFHRGLVAAPDGGLADVDSLLTEELLQARAPLCLRRPFVQHGVMLKRGWGRTALVPATMHACLVEGPTRRVLVPTGVDATRSRYAYVSIA